MNQKLYPVHFRIGRAILVLLTSCIIFSTVRAQTATLLSQGRPAVASSVEGPFAAANAVDGNAGTRWSSAFTNNEWIYVDLGSAATISRVVLNWETAYGSGYQIQVSNNATTWTTIFTTTTGNGGADDLTVSGSGRYVRMLGTARATQFGYSLFEFQVFGTIGGAATLLSQGRPAVASSAEGPFVAANAVDGAAGTRWGSAFTNNEWIYVDLGSAATISRVVLNWETAYGSGYQIQVSDNATTWTTIFTTTTGNGGADDLTVSGSGRYVRMLGTARATQYGYSLFEFQVFGTVGGAATLLSQGRPAVASSVEGPFVAANAVDGAAGTRWGSAFTNNEWIYVDLGSAATISRVVLNWETAYGSGYQIQVSDNATTWTTIFTTTTGNGAIDDLTVSGSGRYVRMLGAVRATQYGYSLFEFQVFGTVGAATLLSQGRPAVASSAEGPFVAANAVDGNAGTRWGSAFTNNEWIYVDLGSTATISRVALNWEAAFGSGYQIQVSDNATTWTTIFTTTTGNGAIDDLTVS